jgi:hypothetical protein
MKSILLGSGLIALTAAIFLQGILAVILGPLFLGTAFFSALLLIPLLIETVLHPHLTVQDAGLYLKPQVWRRVDFVRWEDITALVPHPLIYNDVAMGRTLRGKNYRPREGVVIVLRHTSSILPFYRLIGSLAGRGLSPAFAISTTTQPDYTALLAAIEAKTRLTVQTDPFLMT